LLKDELNRKRLVIDHSDLELYKMAFGQQWTFFIYRRNGQSKKDIR